MNAKQKEIVDRITEMKNQVGDLQAHLMLLGESCGQLKQERDTAIQRAQKAEAELGKQKERARVGRLYAITTHNKLRNALRIYGNPDNWRFTHDKDNNLLWVTSLGPNYAMEILNSVKPAVEQRRRESDKADSKTERYRRALQTIAAWPFDIMGDCVADARNLALKTLDPTEQPTHAQWPWPAGEDAKAAIAEYTAAQEGDHA